MLRGEFECRQVVFWGTGTKRLGTPVAEHVTRVLFPTKCPTIYSTGHTFVPRDILPVHVFELTLYDS